MIALITVEPIIVALTTIIVTMFLGLLGWFLKRLIANFDDSFKKVVHTLGVIEHKQNTMDERQLAIEKRIAHLEALRH